LAMSRVLYIAGAGIMTFRERRAGIRVGASFGASGGGGGGGGRSGGGGAAGPGGPREGKLGDRGRGAGRPPGLVAGARGRPGGRSILARDGRAGPGDRAARGLRRLLVRGDRRGRGAAHGGGRVGAVLDRQRDLPVLRAVGGRGQPRQGPGVPGEPPAVVK